MTGASVCIAIWLQQCRRASPVSSLLRSSALLCNRGFHSSPLSSSLSAVPTSHSSIIPLQQQRPSLRHDTQPSATSTRHRCTAACSHLTAPSYFTSPLSSRTVMSAIDSLPTSSSSSAPLSLLFPLSLPLSVPFPSPFADAPLECAVPKRKPSPRAQRHRRAGQRATHARRLHQTYRICLNCGSPVKPHYLCNRCRQVVGRF